MYALLIWNVQHQFVKALGIYGSVQEALEAFIEMPDESFAWDFVKVVRL